MEEWAQDIDVTRERVCVCEWLTGQMLSMDDPGQSYAAPCWQAEKFFPADEWPSTNSERRYFYYRTIAKKLGAEGAYNRIKLPDCVYEKVERLHPRGPQEKKVGFKRARNPAKPPKKP